MPHDESSSALVPADDVDPALGDGETLSDLVSEQDEQAQEFAIEFFKKVIRLRGVQIDRDDYLRQELHKLGLDDATISLAQETTPVQAGLTLAQLDQLAAATIAFETRKSAAISFAVGLPGGFAMLATIPGDVTQYYVHTFRIMQKLSYIYGWKDFLGGLDEVDDETLGKMSLFLGVMMGVGGASASLTIFAKQIARPALQEQIAKQALTKTAWYGPMKHTLKLIGIKITKDSFAKGVTKTVPVAGGLISGGMTFAALNTQSTRLQKGTCTSCPRRASTLPSTLRRFASSTLKPTSPGRWPTLRQRSRAPPVRRQPGSGVRAARCCARPAGAAPPTAPMI